MRRGKNNANNPVNEVNPVTHSPPQNRSGTRRVAMNASNPQPPLVPQSPNASNANIADIEDPIQQEVHRMNQEHRQSEINILQQNVQQNPNPPVVSNSNLSVPVNEFRQLMNIIVQGQQQMQNQMNIFMQNFNQQPMQVSNNPNPAGVHEPSLIDQMIPGTSTRSRQNSGIRSHPISERIVHQAQAEARQYVGNLNNSRQEQQNQNPPPPFFNDTVLHPTFNASEQSHLLPHNQARGNEHYLKAAGVQLPEYKGFEDEKTPFDFLLELEKYQQIANHSEAVMLSRVVPSALKGEAYNWLRYEPPFRNWFNFKSRFRSEFQAVGYSDDLKKELELRTQGSNETLTAYIRVIYDYYERIGEEIVDIDVVKRIMRQMHPEFRQALSNKRINTLRELKDAALDAQYQIKANRTYKPPCTGVSLEPSLAWKPPNVVKERSQDESSLGLTYDFSRREPKLHFSSVDPFAYYHNSQPKKEVRFRSTSPLASENTNKTPPRTDNSSRTLSSPRQGCFQCGQQGHFKRECPVLKSPIRKSENSQAPSPNRQKGLGQ